MKRLLIIFLTIITYQVALAGGYQTFHDGTTLYGLGKYSDALEKFEICISDPVFANVKSNIQEWIDKCNSKINEQKRNAQAAAQQRRFVLEERKKNNYVYLTVNTTENGVLYSTTESALSEVLRKNGRRFHSDIMKASSVATVNIDIERRFEDKIYYATVSGAIRFGNAIDQGQFDGQASYTMIEGKSIVNMEDATDIALQKINKKLVGALNNILRGEPVVEEETELDNSIVVYLSTGHDKDGHDIDKELLSVFYNAIGFYVDKSMKYHCNPTVDPRVVQDLETEYTRQGKMTTRKERTRIGEQKGIRYMLRLVVSQLSDGSFDFSGNIFDMDTGYSILSSPEQGYSFKNIYTLDKSNQELAASIIATGLGLKKIRVGDKLGDYMVAKIDEEHSHGLLMMNSIIGPEPKWSIADVDYYLLHVVGPNNRQGWRYPYSDELEAMIPFRDKLGLRNTYWAEDSPAKGVYYIVNFQNRENPVSSAKGNKKDYYSIFVKDF